MNKQFKRGIFILIIVFLSGCGHQNLEEQRQEESVTVLLEDQKADEIENISNEKEEEQPREKESEQVNELVIEETMDLIEPENAEEKLIEESEEQEGINETIIEKEKEESVPESEASSQDIDNEKMNNDIPYVAPEGYYSPVFETGIVTGGDYLLEKEVMGLKVWEVQKALNMDLDRKKQGYYREETINEVKKFQRENGLEETGVVDLATWLGLGLSEDDWNYLGTYVTPVKVDETFSREQIVEVFLDTANSYLGDRYLVGASGDIGQGVDCSGFVLQCLYAIGIYPDGIDPVQHSTIEEYNSYLMWQDEKFIEISQEELLPGDLVFYDYKWDETRPVDHVAIYIGNNQCIEAYRKVEILELDKSNRGYKYTGFKRVIAD